MEIKAKSKKEIGETARIVHKSYFDKTKYAIDNGFYLEALCMEYASMEGRMKVLMREMGMECGIKKSAKDHPDVPLKRRFVCLKRALQIATQIGRCGQVNRSELATISGRC